jgi:AcrR family transcriptional regulator
MKPAARERLLDAMLSELAEKGYDDISLTDALVLSGVSEADFAAEFNSVEACLFTAYERLTDRLSDLAKEGCAAAGGEWPDRVRAGLEALLEELAVKPQTATLLTRSFPSIGPEAHALYLSFVEGFAPLLREGRVFSGMRGKLPAEVEMLAVGAAEAIVFEEIEAGRAAQLPDLAPEILFSMLVPFLGPDVASTAMARAKQAAG